MTTTTYYYRYLDPDNADEYVTKSDHAVWYYVPNQVGDPPRCVALKDRPANAIASVVGSPESTFAAGDELGIVVWDGTKDPRPPPPPPPPAWHSSLVSYLKQTNVAAFFDGAPRRMRVG